MKPFKLEKAKEGKPVQTRCGWKAEIIYYDRKGDYPLVVILRDSDASDDSNGKLYGYSTKGKVEDWQHQGDKGYDLFMAPIKKEGWINIYRDAQKTYSGHYIHNTEEEAKELAHTTDTEYIGTTKIEWEEY